MSLVTHLQFCFQKRHNCYVKSATDFLPSCYISTLVAGDMSRGKKSMNENRQRFLSEIGIEEPALRYATQVHSRRILLFTDEAEPFLADTEADGIITTVRTFVPAVVVADCMPIFLYDSHSGAFGVLHSGWKGTGIAADAIDLLGQRFGSKPSEVFFIFGPHIRSCCYVVDKSRAAYFSAIDKNCVRLSLTKFLQLRSRRYALSLAQANRTLLVGKGVPPENIADTGLCTCCTKSFAGSVETMQQGFVFGSNCRENSGGKFTRMLAVICAAGTTSGAY